MKRKKYISVVSVLLLLLCTVIFPMYAFAAEVATKLEVTSQGSWTVTGSQIYRKINGKSNLAGQSDTITIKNTGTVCTVTVTGSMTIVSSWGTGAYLKISDGAGEIYNKSSSDSAINIEVELDAGEELTIVINSANRTSNYTEATLNFSVVREETYNVEFLPPVVSGASYTVGGSNTVSYGGSSYTPSTGLSGTSTTVLTPTAPAGYTFAGWMVTDADNGAKTILTGNSFTPVSNCTVQPVFSTQSTEVFQVGKAQYYTWETAFTAAGENGTVILINNYTLPGAEDGDVLLRNGVVGDISKSYSSSYLDYTPAADGVAAEIVYKVPAGVTFLIPYNDAHTGLATGDAGTVYPQVVDGVGSILNTANYPSRYAKGTLTVGAHTTIQSKGTFIVNGQQWATDQRDTGSVCGPHGLVNLTKSTSKLHVQTGTLYCYGFIIGDGTVKVDNGAAIYEMLQLTDWRGFTATLSWMGTNLDMNNLSLTLVYNLVNTLANTEAMQKTNRSFIFSQYYVQNVEADLQLAVGATLNTALAMNTKEETPQFIIPFVSAGDSFLNLSGSGNLTREYDAGTDRTTYIMDCNVTTGGIDVTFGAKLLGIDLKATLQSEYNIFPINSNLSIVVKDGRTFTLATDMKLLPGATVDVEAGANVVLAEGVEFYLYDKNDWLAGSYAYNAYLHRVNYVATNEAGPYARTINESSKLNVDGTLTVKERANLFTTVGYVRNDGTVGNDAGNTDKLVTGIGKIVNNATTSTDSAFGKLDEFEFSGSFTTAHRIKTTPFVARLSGVTDGTTNKYNSFAAGTYYGQSNNYWYNYIINVDPDAAKAALASTAAASSNTTVTRYNSNTPQTRDTVLNVLGFVSNYCVVTTTADTTTYTEVQSGFKFTAAGYDVYLNSQAESNKLAPDANGVYTLSKISADTTLVLVSQSTGAIYSVTISWKQTSTAEYSAGTNTYTWDPDTLRYVAKTEGAGWESGESVMVIAVDNTGSTGAVVAKFDYESVIKGNAVWSGSDQTLSVAAGASDSATLIVTPSEAPSKPDSGTEVTLGTVTVTLKKEE